MSVCTKRYGRHSRATRAEGEAVGYVWRAGAMAETFFLMLGGMILMRRRRPGRAIGEEDTGRAGREESRWEGRVDRAA